MKQLIDDPSLGLMTKKISLGNNSFLYDTETDNLAIVKNNKVVEILLGNPGGKMERRSVFSDVRNEKSNKKYLEVFVEANGEFNVSGIFSVNRETLQMEFGPNESMSHIFPGGNLETIDERQERELNSEMKELQISFTQSLM